MTEEEITKALNTPIPAYSNAASRQSVGTGEVELRDQNKCPAKNSKPKQAASGKIQTHKHGRRVQGGTTTAPQRKQRKRGRDKGQRAIDQIWKRQRNEERTVGGAQPQEEKQADADVEMEAEEEHKSQPI